MKNKIIILMVAVFGFAYISVGFASYSHSPEAPNQPFEISYYHSGLRTKLQILRDPEMPDALTLKIIKESYTGPFWNRQKTERIRTQTVTLHALRWLVGTPETGSPVRSANDGNAGTPESFYRGGSDLPC